jgi:hypothetical protein
MLFRKLQEPRSILFGMKMTKSEAKWLRERAVKEGSSRSSVVRKLLADLARNEGDEVRQERG